MRLSYCVCLACVVASTVAVAAPPKINPKAKSSSAPAASSAAPGGGELKDQKEKVSYSLGLNFGRSLKAESVEVDTQKFLRGLQDGLTEAQALLTDEQIAEVLQAFQQEVMAKAEAKMKDLGAKNQKEGAAFLTANKKKQGVVALPSGLQYKVIKAGQGEKPAATDTVKTNYRGTLLDGTEFDSSYKRGEPATFPVNRVIKGWQEALQLMPVGSKWQLFVPAELAYGDQGMGPDIAPHSTLVFEVELLGIEK